MLLVSLSVMNDSVCPLPYVLLMISQTGGFGGFGPGGGRIGGGEGGGGNLHPGGTIQNCAACSHDLSIVPLGSLQSSMVLLSQYPTEYQQNFKMLMNSSTSQTAYHDGEISAAINQDGLTNLTVTNIYSNYSFTKTFYCSC